MRNETLAAITAVFALSAVVSAPDLARAYPSDSQIQKDAKIKNGAASDAAMSKDIAKDAKKKAHRARKDAKAAAHKSEVAKKSDQAAGAPNSSQ